MTLEEFERRLREQQQFQNYKIYKKLDILPFLIIWGLGVVSGFVNFDDISFHEILRFSFYVFTPIVSIILGYIISRDDNKGSI